MDMVEIFLKSPNVGQPLRLFDSIAFIPKGTKDIYMDIQRFGYEVGLKRSELLQVHSIYKILVLLKSGAVKKSFGLNFEH